MARRKTPRASHHEHKRLKAEMVRICLEEHLPIKDVCVRLGVSYERYRKWAQRDQGFKDEMALARAAPQGTRKVDFDGEGDWRPIYLAALRTGQSRNEALAIVKVEPIDLEAELKENEEFRRRLHNQELRDLYDIEDRQMVRALTDQAAAKMVLQALLSEKYKTKSLLVDNRKTINQTQNMFWMSEEGRAAAQDWLESGRPLEDIPGTAIAADFEVVDDNEN